MANTWSFDLILFEPVTHCCAQSKTFLTFTFLIKVCWVLIISSDCHSNIHEYITNVPMKSVFSLHGEISQYMQIKTELILEYSS